MLFRLSLIMFLLAACGKPAIVQQRTPAADAERNSGESPESVKVEKQPGTASDGETSLKACVRPCQIDLLNDSAALNAAQSVFLWGANQTAVASLQQRVIAPGARPTAPGAYLVKASSHGGQSGILVKPPLSAEGYYARLVFPLPERLAKSHTYYFNLEVSVRNYAGSGAISLPIKVIALGSGPPTINEEQTFAILGEQTIALKAPKPKPIGTDGAIDDGTYTRVSFPLGISHRRAQFAILLQVDTIALGSAALEIRHATLDQGPPATTLGLARSNLQWQTDWPRQIQELGQFNQNFTANDWFRMEAFGNSAAEIAQAQQIAAAAKAQGMKILLLVMPWDGDFPAGVMRSQAGSQQFKSVCGYDAGVYPVSKIDTAKFIDKIKNYVGAIRKGGAQLAGLIIMNEIDIMCFNGDLPGGRGRVSVASIAPSLNKYAEILKAVYQLRTKDLSLKLFETEIISASLANVSGVFGGKYIDAVEMIQYLRNLGGVDYLKAYSTAQDLHLYPELWDSYNADPKKEVRAVIWRVSQALPKYTDTYANPSVRLFMTEFGRPLNAPATANDPQRWRRFHTYMKWMHALNSLYDVHIVGAMMYAYDSPMSQFSVRLFPAHPTNYTTGPEVYVLPQYLGRY